MTLKIESLDDHEIEAPRQVCPRYKLFSFPSESRCGVRDCMFNSRVARAGCIVLSRKEAECPISNEEIAYYKGLSTKEYWPQRDEADKAIKQLVTLKKFVDFVDNLGLTSVETSTILYPADLLSLLARKPFCHKEVGVTRRILPLLFSYNLWQQFRKHFAYDELVDITHRQVLGLRRRQMKHLAALARSLVTKRGNT